MSSKPHTNVEEEKGRYRVLRAEQSSCPDCGRLVHLLTTDYSNPSFYICFGCRFVGQVGVGRVAVPEGPRELPDRQPEHWDFEDAVAYLDFMKNHLLNPTVTDWGMATSWFERLVREYRHKVEVAQSWFKKARASHLYQAERLVNSPPYPWCCAPGCGDKIKDETALKVTGFEHGEPRWLEDCCIENFVHGHPDHGGRIGDLELINDGTVIRYDPDYHKAPPLRSDGRFGPPQSTGVTVVPRGES